MDRRSELFAFAHNTVLRAGAGTGKTDALTTVYLHLVSQLASPLVWSKTVLTPERIVALTFTEKAAEEMRERIAEAVALLGREKLPAELLTDDAEQRREIAQRWGTARGLTPGACYRLEALAASARLHGKDLPQPESLATRGLCPRRRPHRNFPWLCSRSTPRCRVGT